MGVNNYLTAFGKKTKKIACQLAKWW